MTCKKNKEEAAVPLSAMIDVVFLLLIYFIITQKPIIEDVFHPADLPTAPPPIEVKIERPPFKIDVIEGKGEHASQQYRIDGRTLSLQEVQDQLAIMPRETTVILSCDPNSPHYKLINVLDILSHMQFLKLNLVDDPSIKFRN